MSKKTTTLYCSVCGVVLADATVHGFEPVPEDKQTTLLCDACYDHEDEDEDE